LGIKNGESTHSQKNFYHKPVSINWDFRISDKTTLSSVFYGSWGRGGGAEISVKAHILQHKTVDGLLPY
jgi:hypothetical protein